MSDAEPSLAELLERALRSSLTDVHVSMPGEIVSYDAAKQVATVRLCLRRTLPDENGELVAEEIPPVQNVPVVWPGGSGLTLHGTLAAGDTGDVIFSSMSHNEWQASGRVSTPGDTKPHNLGSAKFYPGLRHKKNAAPDTDNSIGIPGGLRAHFTAGSVSIGAGSDFVAMSAKVEARLSALESWANAHTHATAALGPPVPGLPALVPAGPVASSNLKAV